MVNALPLRAVGILAGLSLLPLVIATAVSPQQDGNEPLITYQNLNDGDVLSEPPQVVQFCFARPVQRAASGTDYRFSMKTPEGLAAGHRTVFQRDSYGVTIYPGDPPSRPSAVPLAEEQVWTFEWLFTDSLDGSRAEGVISFTIDEDGKTIPNEAPPPCIPGAPTGGPGETASGLGPSEDAGDEDGRNGADDDDDTDTFLIVLLVASGAGALVAVSTAAYLLHARMKRDRGDGGEEPSAAA